MNKENIWSFVFNVNALIIYWPLISGSKLRISCNTNKTLEFIGNFLSTSFCKYYAIPFSFIPSTSIDRAL